MAGDWIKLEKETLRKPEVLKLAAALSIHPDHALGVALRFWAWADGVTSDGRLSGITAQAIDDSLGYAGFTSTMLSVGWLREVEHGFSIPRFERHMGANAKKRLADLERQRKKRERDIERDIERDNSVTLSFSSSPKGETSSGIEEGSGEKKGDVVADGPTTVAGWPAYLTGEWLKHFTGTQMSERDPTRLREFFAGLIAEGIKPEEILERIRDTVITVPESRRRPGRECTWDFAKRFGAQANGTNGNRRPAPPRRESLRYDPSRDRAKC